jgi:ketosteroid isomerase-like protein
MASDPGATESFQRLVHALQTRDVEALLELVADEYSSEQPVHPARQFEGAAQVRKNWSTMFSEIPDFRAELLRSTVAQNVAWSEWHWTGTARSGQRLDEMGVALFGFRDGKIVWGRLYMEPVEHESGTVDAQMEDRVR